MAVVEADESLFYDEPSEQLLAAALLSTAVRHEIPALLEDVAPTDFYNTTYGELWRAAGRLHSQGKRISRRTLAVEADNIPRVGDLLERLSGAYVPEVELPAAAKSLPEKAKWRILLRELAAGISDATRSETYGEALVRANARLQQLSQESAGTGPDGPKKLSDAVSDWWDEYHSDEQVSALPLPWEHLNEALAGGLHRKRTYIIGARPGGGKTLMALNAAVGVAEAGYKTLAISLEMPEKEAVSRILSSGAEANYSQVTSGEIDQQNLRRLALYTEGRVQDTELWIYDKSAQTVEQICAQARRLHASVGLDALFVDYAGIVKPTDRTVARHTQLDHITWTFSNLAKELDIAVVYASQLNRGPESDNTKPKKSDLRESGALEQNADVIILLHHEKIDGIHTGDVTVILAKNRTGPECEVKLPWRPNYAKVG
ncbi:AAA family ATPase [Rhodococcus hoagii]|uniref:DNA 5'-3' helicase n=1 Tax=Rhodococcus hoagii TaxID=43767 RepID=A0A9Q4ZIT7_RHOHA|nr:AAA family ATPase [Prescottella equi]NKT77320.1 AAA family ATPase [Prescottella equi]NKZ81107.1 AAA family ATPase [Prescottella equi]